MKEFQESNESYRQMIEEIEDYAILRLDRFGNILNWNKGSEKIKGYQAKEIIGKNFDLFYTKEEQEINLPRKLLERARLSGKARDEGWRVRKDGSRFWGNILITAIHDEKNDVIGFSKITRDLSDKKNAFEIKTALERSHENLMNLFNSSPAGMSLTHVETRKLFEVNKSFLSMFGFEKEELIGLNAAEAEIISEESRTKLAIILKNQGYLKNEDILCYTKERKKVNCILSVDLFEIDRKEYFISVFQDTSKMKELEKINLENEEKFRKTFDISPAGITIINLSDLKFSDANDAFIKMTGFTKDELIGKTSLEIGLTKQSEDRQLILDKIKKEGSNKHFDAVLQTKSGKELHVISSSDTITLHDEKQIVSVIYDITERKKIEQQLLSANEELEGFSYTVSHDLKGPLRIINNYASKLEENRTMLDEDGKRLLSRIQVKASKMSNLIDNLLEFSKLGTGSIKKISLNMNELFEEVLTDLNTTVNHNAEIKLGRLEDAVGDLNMVRQVITNLISNAIKYSSKKINPIIEISSSNSNGEVIYKIMDNGEGFDMIHADSLFEAFKRAHASSEFEGSGIGLAIVKNIVNKHGGKIWAEAKTGEGATFRFTLSRGNQ